MVYKNELDQELIPIISECTKLKSLRLDDINKGAIDGDKVLAILNQALPKNLNTLIKVCVNIVCRNKLPKNFSIFMNSVNFFLLN